MISRTVFSVGFFLVSTVLTQADWPQWRGPHRDGHAAPTEKLPAKLPEELKRLWKVPVGGGFSGLVVANGKLLFLDEQAGQEMAHFVDIDSGKQIWERAYAPSVKDEWGAGPRATPILDGSLAFVQSCNGEFHCLSLTDGETVWQTSFEKQFGVAYKGAKAREGTAQRRGNNGSGVIDGNRLILPVGNTNGASLVCFEKTTGKELWRTGGDEAAYSSLMVATLAGKKQVVAFTADALLGADLENGSILWRQPLQTAAKRHAATPVVHGDTVTVNSHTFGLIQFRISREGDGFKAEKAWENTDMKINLATPVLVDGFLYSQGADKDLVCVDWSSGALKWSQPAYGKGLKDYASIIAVGRSLLVLTEDGQLSLVEANPEKYCDHGRVQACGNTWAFPALSGGKLFVRDNRELSCIELR